MTSINNYQCHYTLIKKMMTSKPEDRLRKKGVKIRKYYKCLRWSMKYVNITIFGNLFSILYKNSLCFFIEKKKDIVTLSKKEYNFFNYKKGDFYGN